MSQSLNVTYKYLRNEPKDQNPFLPINLSEDQIGNCTKKSMLPSLLRHQVQVVSAMLI